MFLGGFLGGFVFVFVLFILGNHKAAGKAQCLATANICGLNTLMNTFWLPSLN